MRRLAAFGNSLGLRSMAFAGLAWLALAATGLAQPLPRTSWLSFQGVGSSDVVSGHHLDWLEFGPIFRFDDHVDALPDIEVVWSIASSDPPRVYFYVWEFPIAEVALAPGVQQVSDVSDASTLEWDEDWVSGIVGVGEFAFFRNPSTGFYGAMRLDGAFADDGSQGEADVTWYFQPDGTDDFSGFVFAEDFESGDLSFWSASSP